MYAVIATGGKQYRVTEGETLKVEKIAGEEGSEIELDQVSQGIEKELRAAPPAAPPVPGTPPPDFAALAVLMDEIRNMAGAMDPDCEDKANELFRLLVSAGEPEKNLAATLAAQARDYDFEEALETLDRIRFRLEACFSKDRVEV